MEPYLRHVVLFKFKDEASKEQIETIEKAFVALKDKIQLIKAFEWGTDVSVEGIHQGFTHCFFITFASEEDRDAYIPHPEHQNFVSLIQPLLDKACVVDYWVR